jgi:hydrogenase maturation protease
MNARLCVIGYGNELRGDDGAGPRVARAVAGWRLPGVLALAVQQLTPELAEPLAGAEVAVFVDAGLDPAEAPLTVAPVLPAATSSSLAHTSDPAWLLGLTRAVYGRHPSAWLVTIPACDLNYSTDLSPAARAGVEAALARIALLAGEAGRLCHESAERCLLHSRSS